MKKLNYIILPLIIFTLASCEIKINNSSSPSSSEPTQSSDSSSSSSSSKESTPSSSSESSSTSESSSSSSSSSSNTSIEEYTLKEEYKHDVIKSNVYTGTYYDSINTTDKETLITELNALINSNYKKYSYSTQTSKLKITDSYDSNYVECLYTGRRMDPDNSGIGAGQWNKEHIWAKTYGFKDESYQAYSDIQMLRIAESSINGARSDKYFDNVTDGSTSYGCKYTSDTFEPRDEVKGDVARIMFYMTVMYNSDTLNLVLTDDVTKINDSKGKLGGTQYLGKLSTLLKWAAEDPVDEREISRNNAVFGIQKNRNPFIDHPEYAYYIFKDECDALNLSYDDFYDNNTYVGKNDNAIAYMNSLVDSIGEVTLAKESLINNINSLYNELDSETDSFFTGYEKLQEATYKLGVLKDLSNRDTTISTSIDLTGLVSNTGSVSQNGINIDYVASLCVEGKGLYSQTSKSLTMNVNNLYGAIKTCTFTINSNKNEPSGKIVISDGEKSVELEISTTKSKQTYSLNVSELDLTKEVTITVVNSTGNSIILSKIEFNI